MASMSRLHAKTLKDLLACVREIPIHGLSITMPYKESIVEHLDNTDSHTTKIGACNTVVRAQDGKALRLQYRYCRRGAAAGAAHRPRECARFWCWERAAPRGQLCSG